MKYKKRTVIRVRYLNKETETGPKLSRPHKVQKILYHDGSVKYFNMNFKWEIDPSTFTTEWEDKKTKAPAPKPKSVRSVLRVKLRAPEDPTKLSRPTRIFKYDEVDKDGNVLSTSYRKYTHEGKYGKIIPLEEIVFLGDDEWKEKGPIPTPKPSRKYTKEQLKSFGYDDELIKKIHRNWSAKNVRLLVEHCGDNITIDKAVELYEKYGDTHSIVTNENEIATFIEKHKADQKEAKKHVVHMGKYTHKKRKINYKPNSRRGRKMARKGIPVYRDDKKSKI